MIESVTKKEKGFEFSCGLWERFNFVHFKGEEFRERGNVRCGKRVVRPRRRVPVRAMKERRGDGGNSSVF